MTNIYILVDFKKVFYTEKIKIVKLNQINKDFMVIARIESLILEKGMRDAISRAHAYMNAGADGIMIHSRKKNPKEINSIHYRGDRKVLKQ